MDTEYCDDNYIYKEHVLPTRWRWKASRKEEALIPISNTPQFFRDVVYRPPPDGGAADGLSTSPRPSQKGWSPGPPRDTSPSPIPTPPVVPRRSTRQPGLVKNHYIVREALALKAARNRVYALIDACEEAKRSAEAAKTLRQAVEDHESVLPASLRTQALLNASARSRSSTPAIGKVKKRKRGEFEHWHEERYDHAYGYGDKDGEDIDLERELEKEYNEIVSKLWVEGPATTGAVISYMKARRRLLQVVNLVRQWEAYKLKHNIADSDLPTDSSEQPPPAARPSRPKPAPRTQETIRRSTRSRVPVARAAAQEDPEPKRKQRRKNPTDTSPLKSSRLASTSFTAEASPSSKANERRSQSTLTDEHSTLSDDSTELVDAEAQPPDDAVLVPSDPEPVAALTESAPEPTVSPRKSRRARTAANTPQQAFSSLAPEQPAKESSSLSVDQPKAERASSHPGFSATESGGEGRTLRSRTKINLPTRFEGFVSTAAVHS
ncbi:hypothetical protein FRB99_007930 [Tulasnella sp. 403]|nr:hypothetical protein FRB99_007930 [Tulasnella sp. 403]